MTEQQEIVQKWLATEDPANVLADLAWVGRDLVAHLRDAGWTGDIRPQQTLCLVEEAGEFAAAARRYLGMARRTGTLDEARMELADVVITAFVTADVFGIDLAQAIVDKLNRIYNRPWREGKPA